MSDEEIADNNVIQQTSDYEQFKLIEANREQNRGHIEALKRAFDETGNLTKVQPILVNERFEIIDGQHRFIAAKERKEPIYYTIVPGLRIEDARKLNLLQRTWKIDDFAHSYAKQGYVSYQNYLKLREDYGINHSVALAAMFPTNARGQFKNFREGALVLPDEALPAIRERLDMLMEALETSDLLKGKHGNRDFAQAFFRVTEMDGYDQERMVKKLKLFGPILIHQYASPGEYQRMLEEIFNYKTAEANRVRLY